MIKPVEPQLAKAAAAASGTPEDGEMVSLYQAHQKIYPRSVSGVFTSWRWVLVWATQIVFYGLPWLEWGQRQAVVFDIGARRFYIFGLVLFPQDFIYLTGLLVISALSLFLFTAVAGRLWCGYACPQTVYTEVFLWIEKVVEGDRGSRIRLDRQTLGLGKLGRKVAKHGLWLVLAGWTGLSFVGYFTPIRELTANAVALAWTPWELFWVVFYGFATYGNAGFMREQVCKYMCPYARFQSAMFDRDTLIVTYDAKRGEPRGVRTQRDDAQSLGLGACIDCGLCVQVCPTGIDIRKGLQYECIGCGACADVCDTVMDKVGAPRGLVRYSTQTALEQGWGRAQILRRIARARVLIYSAILLAVVVAMVTSLALRIPFKVDIMRDRGSLARMANGGLLENVYRVQIMNATESPQRFTIAVSGLPGLQLGSPPVVEVAATEVRGVALLLQLPDGAAAAGSHPVTLEISMQDSSHQVREGTVFLVPR